MGEDMDGGILKRREERREIERGNKEYGKKECWSRRSGCKKKDNERDRRIKMVY